MKIAILDRQGASPQVVDLIARLVDSIPWPQRRSAMGDVTLAQANGLGSGSMTRWSAEARHQFMSPHLERLTKVQSELHSSLTGLVVTPNPNPASDLAG